MKLIIDDANIDKIKSIYDYFPVDGVTTNPSILAKTGRPPFETLKEIRRFIGEGTELHVQVISSKSEQMVEEANRIVGELGEMTYVKIPTTREGIKAMQHLSKASYKVTATAIYTQMQAFLAAKAGADYAAPYINRIDNLGADGIRTTKEIHDIFSNNGLKTEVLAASFKNSQQVLALCAYGIGAATIAPEVIEGLVQNDSVFGAVSAFIADFESLCGKQATMLSC
ncbi:transaldolase family protein [Eubacterium barkeri]|uniref:Fructose-6-phosphate aldolase, TalC/MipB family n=1 Tax=Eubacterium barkeri TaxID=1528 RepID=A0A1H3JLW9_EUBBA|nr:transaldolase family protein [Eubacterium barkeri]SDY40525.1 fructose-6-phosphate aldolase, TalC/MipB family [Eubacterium barkeri]